MHCEERNIHYNMRRTFLLFPEGSDWYGMVYLPLFLNDLDFFMWEWLKIYKYLIRILYV